MCRDLWDGFNIDPNIAFAGAVPFEALTLNTGIDSSGYQVSQDTNNQAFDNLSQQIGDQQYTGNVSSGQDYNYQADNSYQQSYQDSSYQQSYQDNSYQQSYTQNFSYQPDYSYQQNNW